MEGLRPAAGRSGWGHAIGAAWAMQLPSRPMRPRDRRAAIAPSNRRQNKNRPPQRGERSCRRKVLRPRLSRRCRCPATALPSRGIGSGAREPVLARAPEPALPPAAGFALRGAERFLAFFFGGRLFARPPSAFFAFAAFFFLRAGAARFVFFAFVFDFFRFFAMIVLPIVAAQLSVQSGLPAPGCKTSSCKARACSVPLRAPPRQSAPQRR